VDAASSQGQAGADPPSSQVRQRALTAVAGVSLAALADVGELSELLGARLLADHPAFGQDATLEGEMHLAIHANLWHVFERVMPTGVPDTLVAPPDALRFTASVVRRGIDTSDLIQAYRTGQNLAWSWWIARLSAHLADANDVLIVALQISSERMFSYVDAAIDQQMRHWDSELIGAFVRSKLGGLAADDPATERLRENVLVWLREGGSNSRAAERLNTHRNTVKYRIEKAEEALGHSVGEDRLGLELALTLAERLGVRMLR
jgi:hypothetical protein